MDMVFGVAYVASVALPVRDFERRQCYALRRGLWETKYLLTNASGILQGLISYLSPTAVRLYLQILIEILWANPWAFAGQSAQGSGRTSAGFHQTPLYQVAQKIIRHIMIRALKCASLLYTP